MTVEIRKAAATDAAALAQLAALTFGLACPPGTAQASIDEFLATTLSESRFDDYLADPARMLFVASSGGLDVGYAMLVFGEPTDGDVLAAITLRPTSELSKLYVLAHQHGAGISSALVAAAVDAARLRGCAGMWLGVNEQNGRANRFYEKSGFARVGAKKFLLGGKWEDDFVRERRL
jgi:diamine N-acetyltransferase